MNKQKIIVSINLCNQNKVVGFLYPHFRSDIESATFEYASSWLEDPVSFSIDPYLQLREGKYQTKIGYSLFGCFEDASPDTWGRNLMRRAKRSKTAPPYSKFNAVDYLLGVDDKTRMGALRFSEESNKETYLTDNISNSIPPLVNLGKLLSATDRLVADKETAQDLKLLLDPGSSLGGARPKASVQDKNGRLFIAKFPKSDEDYSVIAWEAVAFELAKKAKINVPECHIKRVRNNIVLLVERFDRKNKERIPFMSAMTMLSAKDNEMHSYLEIAEAIRANGASPLEDLQQLWRRIVFSVMINNTDDHLRNHAFLYESNKGWRLSPAFDLNPTPIDIKRRVLTTAITYNDATGSIKNTLSVVDHFGLELQKAKDIIQEVTDAVLQWAEVAKKLEIPDREIKRLAASFNVVD